MHVDISQDIRERLEFKAAKLLRIHKETTFYNSNYKLRHPFAIYNISMNAVLANFKNLLRALESYRNDQSARELSDKEINRNLIISTDQYLDSIMEHCDDCLSIIKSFFPSEEDKKYKKACRNFNQSIRTFRDHIAKQVNHIKHSQARIRLIVFYNETVSVPGYYIEGIHTNGTVGPHPDIHPGGNSAFSYYREIRYALCGLLFISDLLADTLNKFLPENVAPVEKFEVNSDKDTLAEVFKDIAIMPFVFFPDEYNKAIPSIRLTDNQRIIRYPSQIAKPQKLPANMKITTEFQGDGVSKSFKMPYFGKGI